jgi:ribosomal protein L32E
MPVIIVPKGFLSCLDKFERSGRAEGRKIKEAMVDSQLHGKISLPFSDHGESRIPNVEKYKVSDGDRLVVQIVDARHKARAFLFAGTHDETERWLDSHNGYKWVARESDSKLNFVQVSEELPAAKLPQTQPEPAAQETPPTPRASTGPLLGFLEAEDWAGLALRNETKDFLKQVDENFMSEREEELLNRLPTLEPEKRANLLYDLLCLAWKEEYDELRQRLALHKEEARVVQGTELVAAALEPVNSETLITFNDAGVFREFAEKGGTLSEWMYFLHSSQLELVKRDFNGPARLRGVSGSGKTCVLLHRAKRLAKLYKDTVLIVTLTESMRKLLDTLLDDLCGVERSLIETSTVASVVRRVTELALGPERAVNRASDGQLESALKSSVQLVQTHAGLAGSQLKTLSEAALLKFIQDEFSYIRSRLVKADYPTYLNSDAFPRRGRGLALARTGREAVLDGLYHFEGEIEKLKVADPEAIVQFARTALTVRKLKSDPFRAVLVDEVQDLGQLELETIANLSTRGGEPIKSTTNGLFLVGDGTQTIYRRGFRLTSAGIQITGRSYTLKKNYRNTYEVLRASYALVSNYEFADADEGDVNRPVEPDYASRHGVKPLLVKCRSTDEEAEFVVATISSLCAMSLTPGQICVIGCNKTVREAIQNLLQETGLPFVELKQDVRVDSERIKISTIESSKGHEFHTVLIAGLVDGVMPPKGTDEADVAREAARLYVAMTRASEDLHLSYSPTRDFPASRFLMQVAEHCDERSLVNGHLREF